MASSSSTSSTSSLSSQPLSSSPTNIPSQPSVISDSNNNNGSQSAVTSPSSSVASPPSAGSGDEAPAVTPLPVPTTAIATGIMSPSSDENMISPSRANLRRDAGGGSGSHSGSRGRTPRATSISPGSDGSGPAGTGNDGALPLSDDDTSPAVAHVPGYSSLQSLFENRRSIVLRGIRDSDGRHVIIKLLNADYPSAVQLWLFEQQFELTRSLSMIDGVIQALSLERYHNTIFMVFDDVGGISIRSWLTTNPSLIDRFQVAIKIATALSHIHQRNVVHRDINSNNVVYNPTTKQLQIIDFGISILLSRESPRIQNANVLEGTLQYISPEQTGRMNRSLDYRTDLYSFGVLLFEMFCGRLPFTNNDPTELVHAHIALRPPLPSEVWQWPELHHGTPIANALSSIILRLMAKNKEDRYQSSSGIRADLELCCQAVINGDHMNPNLETPLELRGQNTSSSLQIPEKLYGRDSELKMLMASYQRVIQRGRSHMAMVAGPGGSGKSRLIGELLSKIATTAVPGLLTPVFASGKFDQYSRKPFSAIIQAVSQLIDGVLMQDMEVVTAVKERLLNRDTGVGANISVAISMIPAVKMITGAQPAADAVGSIEVQHRLHRTLCQLLKVFTSTATPLILFVDDLQWADRASIRFIQMIATDFEFRHALIIGSYRDEEVNRGHPLSEMLDFVARAGSLVTLNLKPLNRQTVVNLLMDTLGCNDDVRTNRLAHLIMNKTNGSPFFVIELIRSLYERDILNFDAAQGRWTWDEDKAVRSRISRNVVELMMNKIKSLPSHTQNLLKLASCIGTHFNLATLATISGLSPKEAARGLWKSLVAGLVVAAGENYFVMMDKENASIPSSHIPSSPAGATASLLSSTAMAPVSSPSASPPASGGIGTLISPRTSSRRLPSASSSAATTAATTPSSAASSPDSSTSPDGKRSETKADDEKKRLMAGDESESDDDDDDSFAKSKLLANVMKQMDNDNDNNGVGGKIESNHGGKQVSFQFRFLHDRVRQAAYALMDVKERPQVHLRIGRALLHTLRLPEDYMLQITLPDDELQQIATNKEIAAEKARIAAAALPDVSEAALAEAAAIQAAAEAQALIDNEQQKEFDALQLVDVVNHLNRGQQLVTDHADRLRFSQLNCLAALRVKDTTAFRHALTFALYGTIFLGSAREIVPLLSSYDIAMQASANAAANAGQTNAAVAAVARHKRDAAAAAAAAAATAKANKVSSGASDDDGKSEAPTSSSDGDSGESAASDDSKDAHSSGHGDDAQAEEGALVLIPRSDEDYDTAIRDSVWAVTGQRLLALRLYLLRLELEYFIGNTSEGDVFMKVAMGRAVDGVERARLLGIRAVALCQRSSYVEATASGLEALSHLGIIFPAEPNWMSTAIEEHGIIKARYGSQRVEEIIQSLSAMTRVADRLLSFLLAELSVCAYLSNPSLLALLATRAVLLAMDRGLAAKHALMFAWYGLVSTNLGDVDWGHQWANITDVIFARFPSLRYKGKTMMLINTVISPLHQPWKSTFRAMDAAWGLLMQTGDVQWGGYQLTTMIHIRVGYGTPVLQLLHRLPRYYQWAYKNNHHFCMRTLQAAQLPLLNLIGATTGELDFDAPRVVSEAIKAVEQLVAEGKALGIHGSDHGSNAGDGTGTGGSSKDAATGAVPAKSSKPSTQEAETGATAAPGSSSSIAEARPSSGSVTEASASVVQGTTTLDASLRPIDETSSSMTGAATAAVGGDGKQGTPNTTTVLPLPSAGPGATAAQDAKAAAAQAAANNTGTGTTGSGSGSDATVGSSHNSAANEQRLALISSSMTEAEYVKDCEANQLWTPLCIFRIWQARCYYLYGYYDLAWNTIQKALSLRQYIAGLTPMMEMIPLAALILLAKIGAIKKSRRRRKNFTMKAAAMATTAANTPGTGASGGSSGMDTPPPLHPSHRQSLAENAASPMVSPSSSHTELKVSDGGGIISPSSSVSTPTPPAATAIPPTVAAAIAASTVTISSILSPAARYAEEDIKMGEWWTMIESFHGEITGWRQCQESNFGHMAMLVEAEMARFRGKPLTAMKLYNQAIKAAKQGEWHYHEALCCERVGLLYLARNDDQVAGFWLRRSLHAYRIWGARRKVRQMKRHYHNLLDLRDMPGESKAAAADAAIVARLAEPHTSGEDDPHLPGGRHASSSPLHRTGESARSGSDSAGSGSRSRGAVQPHHPHGGHGHAQQQHGGSKGGGSGAGSLQSDSLLPLPNNSGSGGGTGSGPNSSSLTPAGLSTSLMANNNTNGTAGSTGSGAGDVRMSAGHSTGGTGAGMIAAHRQHQQQNNSGGALPSNAAIAMWRARGHGHLPPSFSGHGATGSGGNGGGMDGPAAARAASFSGGLGVAPWAGSNTSISPTSNTNNLGNNNNANSGTIGTSGSLHGIQTTSGISGNDRSTGIGTTAIGMSTSNTNLNALMSSPGPSTGNAMGQTTTNNIGAIAIRRQESASRNNTLRAGAISANSNNNPSNNNSGGAPRQMGLGNNNNVGGGGVGVGGRGGVNAQIDTQSMLDAATAMSQEMQLDRALMALLTILLTCAGAESSLLISKRRHKWVVEAKASPLGCEVLPTEEEPISISSDSSDTNNGSSGSSSSSSSGSSSGGGGGHSERSASVGSNGSGQNSPSSSPTLPPANLSLNTSTSTLAQTPGATLSHVATPANSHTMGSSSSSTSGGFLTPVAGTATGGHPSSPGSAGGRRHIARDGKTSGSGSERRATNKRRSHQRTSSIGALPSHIASAIMSSTSSSNLPTTTTTTATTSPPSASVSSSSTSSVSVSASTSLSSDSKAATVGVAPPPPPRVSIIPNSAPSKSGVVVPMPGTPTHTGTTLGTGSGSSSNSAPSKFVYRPETTTNNGNGGNGHNSGGSNGKNGNGSGSGTSNTGKTEAHNTPSASFVYRLAALPNSGLSRTPTAAAASSSTSPSASSSSVSSSSAASLSSSSSAASSAAAAAGSASPSFSSSATVPSLSSTSTVTSRASAPNLSTTTPSSHWSLSSASTSSSNGGETPPPPSFSYRPSQPSGLFRSAPPPPAVATAALLSTSRASTTSSTPLPPPPMTAPASGTIINTGSGTTTPVSSPPHSPQQTLQAGLTSVGAPFTSPSHGSSSSPPSTSTQLLGLDGRVIPTAGHSSRARFTSGSNSSDGSHGSNLGPSSSPLSMYMGGSGNLNVAPPTAPTTLGSVSALWMQIPLTLFNYVLHRGRPIILNDAVNDRQFGHDAYIQHYRPKSVMVMPLILRGEIVSILYLENNLTRGAFTNDRLDMVRLLSSQAAISIENARLYTQLERHNRTLEEKVQNRTRQLRDAQAVAERANMAKSLFLSTMSHEIRTPLNGVIGTTHLLLESPHLLDADQLEMVETIRDSGQTLLALINDVLDLTKIESGKFELDLQPFDLRHCIESAMDVVAVKALAQGLDLAYYATPNVPVTAIADVTRVRQILTNLLSNGVKFTAKGEVVVMLEATPLDESQIPILPSATGATTTSTSAARYYELHFAVRDTGIGIPMERAHRLFQIFSQVNTDTSKHYGGTGLGLAISRHFAEMMGGQVWVESQEGKGSIFHFTIRVPCLYDSPPEWLLPMHTPLTGRTVWVVDGSATIRAQLYDMLTYWGMTVRSIAKGPDVLQSLNISIDGYDDASPVLPLRSAVPGSPDGVNNEWRHPPDVMLLSLLLQAGAKVVPHTLLAAASPRITNGNAPVRSLIESMNQDGMALATRIRHRYNKRELPIVLMCPLSERKQEAKAVVNGFGTKPIKPGQLLKAIVAALSKPDPLTGSPSSLSAAAAMSNPPPLPATSPASSSKDMVVRDASYGMAMVSPPLNSHGSVIVATATEPHNPMLLRSSSSLSPSRASPMMIASRRVLGAGTNNPNHNMIPRPRSGSISSQYSQQRSASPPSPSPHGPPVRSTTPLSATGRASPDVIGHPDDLKYITNPNIRPPSSSGTGSSAGRTRRLMAASPSTHAPLPPTAPIISASPKIGGPVTRRRAPNERSTVAAKRVLTILVAEDNLVNQKVIRQMLKMQGYSIDIVDNGQKAADTVMSRAWECMATPSLDAYDIVFMDVQMPVMNGMDASKRIRDTVPAEYQPHIVALTAQAMQGDRDRCLAMGMNDYISKPITKEDILRVLASVPRLARNSHGTTPQPSTSSSMDEAIHSRLAARRASVTSTGSTSSNDNGGNGRRNSNAGTGGMGMGMGAAPSSTAGLSSPPSLSSAPVPPNPATIAIANSLLNAATKL